MLFSSADAFSIELYIMDRRGIDLCCVLSMLYYRSIQDRSIRNIWLNRYGTARSMISIDLCCILYRCCIIDVACYRSIHHHPSIPYRSMLYQSILIDVVSIDMIQHRSILYRLIHHRSMLNQYRIDRHCIN